MRAWNSLLARSLSDQGAGGNGRHNVRRNTKMALKHLLAGVAAVALMGSPALAQDAQQPQAQDEQMQLAQEDMDFATEAAQGGLKEVRLGELAAQQAATDGVRDFGQRMIEDHGAANANLMQIAEQKGIELPQDLSEDAQATYDELQQMSGPEFDQAYTDEMVSDHEQDIATFEDYIENAQDPDLRAFAENTLPTLQEHLEMARQIQEQVVAAGELEQPERPLAADAPADATAAAPAAPAQEQAGFVSLNEVLGSIVINQNGEEVATIDDIVVRDDTQYAVLSVGGFLGLGQRDVAIPLDELQLGEDQVYLMTTHTEEQLEELPEYEPTQYQPFPR
jgi:putative membrane protein